MASAFELRPSAAPEVRLPPKKEEETELSYADVEWIETEEATKLRNQERQRVQGLSTRMEEDLNRLRRPKSGVESFAAWKQAMQVREKLQTAAPIDRRATEVKGANATERWILNEEGQLKDEAFAKRQTGELATLYDEKEKQAYRVDQAVGADGLVHTVYTKLRPGTDVAKKAEADAKQREGQTKKIAATHEVDPKRLLHPQELALRWVEQGHATRAEVAASVLNDAIGWDVIPETVLREDKGDLVSVQERAPGTPMFQDQFNAFLETPSQEPGGKSMMRLACMDYLLMSSDRHANNLFYDEKTQSFKGIDNGYALGRSVKKTVRGMDALGRWQRHEEYLPADNYGSVPMQFVNLDKDWKLDDEARQQLVSIYDAVVKYAELQDGKLSKEELAKLPEDVREGRVAKLLSETFRFLHERKDANGKTDPDSTKIAKLEAHLFLRRMKHLIDDGRPPAWALAE